MKPAVSDRYGGSNILQTVRPAVSESLHLFQAGVRTVVVGNVGGKPVEIRPAYRILKEMSLIGIKSISRLEMERLLSLIARKVLVPKVAESIPLNEASTAHEIMRNDRTSGRIVLVR